MTKFKGALLTVSLFGLSSISQSQTTRVSGCRAEIKREQLERELSQAADKAIASIKAGRPAQLLLLFSDSGVEIGIDGPVLSLNVVRQEMSRRTGIYCLIFNSQCLLREENASRKKAHKSPSREGRLCYRDYLLKKRPKITTNLWDISERCGGSVGTANDSDNFDLEFERTRTGWKIVAIPYT